MSQLASPFLLVYSQQHDCLQGPDAARDCLRVDLCVQQRPTELIATDLPTSVFIAYANATNLTSTDDLPDFELNDRRADFFALDDFYFVPAESVKKLKDFEVVVQGKSFTLSPSAQLLPDALSAAYLDPSIGRLSTFRRSRQYFGRGDDDDYVPSGYLGVRGSCAESRSDLCSQLPWFERYTTSMETTGKSRGKAGKISFGQTEWTFAQTSKKAPASKTKPASGCTVKKV